MEFAMRAMQETDWKTVQAIYREGIATGNTTFETDAPEWEEWDTGHLRECRLVAKTGDGVVGWVAVSPVSRRRVYAGVVEISLYVATTARGLGVGKALLQALITESERAGIWTLQAGIFPENHASLAVVRACGFREVGRRERMGQLHSVWRDVVLVERRSKVVGV